MKRWGALCAVVMLIGAVLPGRAQAPVPPAGIILVDVAVSDGAALLPAASWVCAAVKP